MSRRHAVEMRRCSFCEKPENEVWKLVSSPREDRPASYICDECVAVCQSIFDDERQQAAVNAIADDDTVLSLLNAVGRWVKDDSPAELAALRQIAVRVFGWYPG
jgi:ATP-dependent protease Clp ATPase subunit